MAKAKKLPFLFTPPIIRYVERILFEYEKRGQGILNQEILPFSIHFETYKVDEPFMSHSEDMRKSFVDYLTERGAVEFEFISGADSRFFDEAIRAENENEASEKSSGHFEKEFGLRVLDITPIKEIWVYHTKHPNPSLLKGTEAIDSCEVRYDKDTRRLTFHKKFHTFHKGQKVKVFEALWERRSHRCGGVEIKSRPEALSPAELADVVGMKSARREKDLKTLLHNTQSVLLAKGFPIRIKSSKESVLMTIKEV